MIGQCQVMRIARNTVGAAKKAIPKNNLKPCVKAVQLGENYMDSFWVSKNGCKPFLALIFSHKGTGKKQVATYLQRDLFNK